MSLFFIEVSKPLLTEFGIHYRLESCETKPWSGIVTRPDVVDWALTAPFTAFAVGRGGGGGSATMTTSVMFFCKFFLSSTLEMAAAASSSSLKIFSSVLPITNI